jgi:predicted DNA binding CopG/RHH family protein
VNHQTFALSAIASEKTILSLGSFQHAERPERRKQDMLKEYDIDKLNPRPNPYAKQLKKQITINITSSTVDYFKAQASEVGIPYQTLINMYLTDCAENNRKLHLSWE